MGASDQRRQLADFLRSRRAMLQPQDVGIASTGRRRTPGLRREEVSQLSGVSLTWYTWLEQAREINVSRQVLAAIARVLQLSRAETEHLYTLGGLGVDPNGPATTATIPPASLTKLLDALEPNPAYALSQRWDIVAWNHAYAELFLDISALPPNERNLLWLVFTSDNVRALLADDWTTEARRLLAQFRAELGHQLDEPDYAALVAAIQDASTEFREWWSLHDVAYFESRQRHLHHPIAGRLSFDHHKLLLADHPDLRLIVYTATAEDAHTSGP